MPTLDYRFNTPAVFAQHTWTPLYWFAMTSGARVDFHTSTIPSSARGSALARLSCSWTARLSGGLGAYTQTPFVEEMDEISQTHTDNDDPHRHLRFPVPDDLSRPVVHRALRQVEARLRKFAGSGCRWSRSGCRWKTKCSATGVASLTH